MRGGFDEDENDQAIPVESGYTPENERLEARNYPIEQENHLSQPNLHDFGFKTWFSRVDVVYPTLKRTVQQLKTWWKLDELEEDPVILLGFQLLFWGWKNSDAEAARNGVV